MTREKAINELEILKQDYWDDDGYGHETKQYDDTMLALDMAIEALNHKWIPIKTRKLTDAEEQDMLENSNYYYNYMFDCLLPEDGEEVLVTTSTGEVTTTTFYDEGLDGCSFEFYEDDGDVIAWMPKPKSYKTESEVK